MTEKSCHLWLEHTEFRCILTSGAVSGGAAVLETRSARDAAGKFAGIAEDLGSMILARGNHVQLVRPGVIAFPIKQYQLSGPTKQVIERSARELAELVKAAKTVLPKPGCGPGELNWEDVKAALASLPDTVIVTEWS
jgi:hypothetical protein